MASSKSRSTVRPLFAVAGSANVRGLVAESSRVSFRTGGQSVRIAGEIALAQVDGKAVDVRQEGGAAIVDLPGGEATVQLSLRRSTVLKGLDPLLGPDLLHALAAMGHGDELALVDANFPASRLARRIVRIDGADTHELARAVLSVFPLDRDDGAPIVRMEVIGAPAEIPSVQQRFYELVAATDSEVPRMASLARADFYERTRSAFVVLVTGETRPYGCFLLRKGLVGSDSAS